MAWLSTNKTITLFLKCGVSSIGMGEFIIIFLFVIRFFLVPFWSRFTSTMFASANKFLAFTAVHSFLFVSFNDDVGDQI